MRCRPEVPVWLSIVTSTTTWVRGPAEGRKLSGAEAHSEPVPSYLAFIMKAGDELPAVIALGPERELRPLVRLWGEELSVGSRDPGRSASESEAAYRQAGESLRQRIWDRLEPHLEGARLVFVIPDGELQRVSLAALPASGDRYLLETAPLPPLPLGGT